MCVEGVGGCWVCYVEEHSRQYERVCTDQHEERCSRLWCRGPGKINLLGMWGGGDVKEVWGVQNLNRRELVKDSM